MKKRLKELHARVKKLELQIGELQRAANKVTKVKVRKSGSKAKPVPHSSEVVRTATRGKSKVRSRSHTVPKAASAPTPAQGP